MEPIVYQNAIARIILGAAVLAWVLPEVGRGIAASRRGRTGPNLDRGSGRVIMVALWLSVAAADEIAFHFTGGTIRWGRQELFAAGVLFMIGGVAFRWHAIRILGRFFSPVVTVQQEHRVVDRGPYRLIRHPSYSGTLLTMLGYGLALGDWASLVFLLACGLSMYGYRVSVEERALLENLGESYRTYMKRTKRFIPWVF